MPDDQPIAATLASYFEYAHDVFETPLVPAKTKTGPWPSLEQMDFVIASVTVDPAGSIFGNYTEKAQFANFATDRWTVIPDVYAVDRMVYEFSGAQPPGRPGGAPPAQSLTGEVVVGARTMTAQVPLDAATRFDHNVAQLTIGEILDYFGGKIPTIGGLASSTLPCAVAGTRSTALAAAAAVSAEIHVDFGSAPELRFSSTMMAVDPVSRGVLRRLDLTVRDKATYEIEITFDYMEFSNIVMAYPYKPFRCAVRRPPNDPWPLRDLVEAVKLLLLALVSVYNVAWKDVFTYVGGFLDVTSTTIADVSAAVGGGAAQAGAPLTLEQIASAMYGAFPSTVSSPTTMMNALRQSGVSGGGDPAKVIEAVQKANPNYGPADLMKALQSVFDLSLGAASQLLNSVIAYAATLAGMIQLMAVLKSAQTPPDPAAIAAAGHATLPTVSAADLAQADLESGPTRPRQGGACGLPCRAAWWRRRRCPDGDTQDRLSSGLIERAHRGPPRQGVTGG